jgi:hypothetical protein
VYDQAVGVEGVHVGHGHVVDVLFAAGRERGHRRGEALAVQAAPVRLQCGCQALRLGRVGKAHCVGPLQQVVAADDQFVQGTARVLALAAMTVGHGTRACSASIGVDRRGNAHAQQHALHRLQQAQVGLGQAHADTRVLRTLHRSVGIKQATQHTRTEGGRSLLDRRREGLAAGRHAEFEGQVAQGGAGQAEFAPPGDGPLPAGKVRTVLQRLRRFQCGLHDARGTVGLRFSAAIGHQLELGRPGRKHGLVGLERAVAHQQTNQIALLQRVGTVPAQQATVVVQHQLIPHAQLAGRDPFGFDGIAGPATHAPHRVVGRELQAVSLRRLQMEDGLAPRGKEAP